jgi:hypothetical protein
MISHMTHPLLGFYINNFIFRVKMPVKKLVEVRREKDFE